MVPNLEEAIVLTGFHQSLCNLWPCSLCTQIHYGDRGAIGIRSEMIINVHLGWANKIGLRGRGRENIPGVLTKWFMVSKES